MGAEIGTVQLQVKNDKDCQHVGRGQERFSHGSFWGSMALPTPPFQTSGLQSVRIHFFCFKPLYGFWHGTSRKLKQCAKGFQLLRALREGKQNSEWHMVSNGAEEPVGEMAGGQAACQQGCQRHYHREYWEGVTDFSFSGARGGPFDWLLEQLIFRCSGRVRFSNSQSLLLFVTPYFLPKVAKMIALVSLAF